ncbi:hypothetical protein PPERSA_11921 [Pseudocohnilembus persalinus]|uniref:EF-hand domain-containing protein n=1 Tax=Pseudocohnilembus persalinus TaxID=266149 RepID=A0A0V0QKM0_PSEPJ|nr:hypothetical protein PPERSA_11921 [Pseudocohnilembus persalinus]|eukprot:KRX02581.1 hypothetical protein PPERSA_11921 [Pseudocohnilembus persalinus]
MYQFDLDIQPASQQFQKGSEEKQKIIQHNFNLIQQQLNQQQLFDQIQQDNIQQNQEYQENYDDEIKYQIDNSQNIQQSDQHYENMEQQQGQFQRQQMQQQNEQQYQQFDRQNQSQQYQNGNEYLQDQENFQNQSNEQYNFEENGNFMDQNENHQQKLKKKSNNQSQYSSHSEEEEEEEIDESDENDNGQILDMSIDLGDDNVQHLIVYEGDDPMQLAKEFVESNELNEDALEYLSQNIMENMQEAIKEKNEKRQIKQQKKLQKMKEKEEKQQQKEQKRLIRQQEKQKQEAEQEKNITQQSEQQSQQKQNRRQNSQQFSQNNVELSQDNNQSGTQLYETFQASQQQPFFGTYNQFFSASKGKIPVHDRLYLEAQQKEIRLQQKKQMQIQQHNEQHKSIHSLKSPTMKKFGDQSINHGEYLYYSAIQKKEEKEQYNKKIKQFQEQVEASDATFHPKICQKSIMLAEQKKQFALPEDRFRENQYFVNKRKEELKIAVKNKELEECSFHPQINNVLQQEESQMNPQIIRRPPLNDDKTSFFERLDKYNKDKLQRSLNINIQPMVNEKDLKECVFKPKVGRGPQYERNVDKKPIGEYLNSQKDKKQIIQETLLQKDQELQQSMMHKPLSVSSNILNEKKDRILSELFNILDSDGDGFITKTLFLRQRICLQ